MNGIRKRKVASINPTTGATVTGFQANANSAATSLEATNSTVYISSQFTTINNTARASLAAVNADTGALTNFRNDISGGIGVNGLLTVQALVLSPNDGKLLVVHTGRRIDGQDRYGVGIIDTATSTLSPWKTTSGTSTCVRRWRPAHRRRRHCARRPLLRRQLELRWRRPPISDTAVAYPLTSASDYVQPLWISRAFDSVYSLAITETAVYSGGHFNFIESPSPMTRGPALTTSATAAARASPATGSATRSSAASTWRRRPGHRQGGGVELLRHLLRGQQGHARGHARGLLIGGDGTTQGGCDRASCVLRLQHVPARPERDDHHHPDRGTGRRDRRAL